MGAQDYKAKWKAAFAKMQPLIQAGALIGTFLPLHS